VDLPDLRVCRASLDPQASLACQAQRELADFWEKRDLRATLDQLVDPESLDLLV